MKLTMRKPTVRLVLFPSVAGEKICQKWAGGFASALLKKHHIVQEDHPQVDLYVSCGQEEVNQKTGIRTHRNTVYSPGGEVLACGVTYMTRNPDSAERRDTFRELSGEQAGLLVVGLNY